MRRKAPGLTQCEHLGAGNAAARSSKAAGIHNLFQAGTYVLDLMKIAETRITDEEVQALHQVIVDPGKYIQRAATGPEADKALLWSRQIVSVTSR